MTDEERQHLERDAQYWRDLYRLANELDKVTRHGTIDMAHDDTFDCIVGVLRAAVRRAHRGESSR